jgi:ketosteroid isomerase-like protein
VSAENVELVRRGVAAFNSGDRDVLRELASVDFEFATSGAIPGLTGVFRGLDDFEKRFYDVFWSEFDEIRSEIKEIIDVDDRVMVGQRARVRGKQSGADVTLDFWQIWTVREGKVVHGQGFPTREEALEALGVSE